MRLSELKEGESAVIIKIHGHGAFRRRVIEMGFVRGKKISCVLNAPLRDPIKYTILDYAISLRRSEADLIEVTLDKNEVADTAHLYTENSSDDDVIEKKLGHTIRVALIGNPNCGKTSLFNVVCGARLHVGNYSGVTVDASVGTFNYKDYHFEFIDLPGTYSLSAYSPEELYVRRYLNNETVDIILNVLDGSNLERNLYLTTELIDMDRSMVIAMNMFDEFEASGAKLDVETLGGMIGVPILPTVSKEQKGIDELLTAIIKVYEQEHPQVRHVHVSLGPDIEHAIMELRTFIRKNQMSLLQFSTRYVAIKLLESDHEIEGLLRKHEHFKELIQLRDDCVKQIEANRNSDVVSSIASEKYGYISGALRETLQEPDNQKMDYSHAIDKFVTSKMFGFPIFVLLMALMFIATFKLGSYPMEWMQDGVHFISAVINKIMPSGVLKDMLIDGVIAGVGGVIVFLPNILILYFLMSFMEDSGYMSRAAFIMDKIMHKIGLHGKSFIPLIMGFGCNVPAIIGTRCIESRSSRLITILILPFMSCSARLPIFVLLAGTFFPDSPALMLTLLYFIGIIVAIITSRLLRLFKFLEDETPFVMELPPYRIPTFRATSSHMWEKGKQYLRKMGGVILVGSLIIWVLSYFPRPMFVNNDEMTPTERYEQQSNSYLAQIGDAITPAMEPLGMNWKMSIALISGASAKEIVVSSLGVLYPQVDDSHHIVADSEDGKTLGERMQEDITSLQALSFMLFVLLYFPCVAAVTAVAKECGSWKYGAFSFCYNTAVAWIISFAVYQIGLLIT